MTGTWTQGANHITLTFARATPETAWAIPEPPARPKPLPAGADPSFEAATIKPANPNEPGRYFRNSGTQFATHDTSVADMMSFVYGVQVRQIVGGRLGLNRRSMTFRRNFRLKACPARHRLRR